MSLNYDEKDKPLFSDDSIDDALSGGIMSPGKVAFWENWVKTKSKIAAIAREDSAHKFSMWLLLGVIVGLCTIVVVEYFPVAENEYVKELFEFFKYVATTVIGYLFATHKNNE